jgi:hypothetical protein
MAVIYTRYNQFLSTNLTGYTQHTVTGSERTPARSTNASPTNEVRRAQSMIPPYNKGDADRKYRRWGIAVRYRLWRGSATAPYKLSDAKWLNIGLQIRELHRVNKPKQGRATDYWRSFRGKSAKIGCRLTFVLLCRLDSFSSRACHLSEIFAIQTRVFVGRGRRTPPLPGCARRHAPVRAHRSSCVLRCCRVMRSSADSQAAGWGGLCAGACRPRAIAPTAPGS